MRAELRGLSEARAEQVGGHLLVAGQLIDDDPELAYEHAQAARQLAPRLPIVREAAGETAYAAGKYQEALTEFRTMRRMSGTDEYLPAMADCERALGRPREALKLIREGLPRATDVTQVVELRLVEAGARTDLGEPDEALRLLHAEIERIGPRGTKVARARLRYGYADHLEQAGRLDEAEQWFAAAARLDMDSATDADERLAALGGVSIDYDETEDAGETGEIEEAGETEAGGEELGNEEPGEAGS